MGRRPVFAGLAATLLVATLAWAQPAEQVVDIPTRPGVTQRLLVLTPAQPRASVVLMPGGHGGLRIFPSGSMQSGEGNFLVRSRRLFADQGLRVVVVDSPSDRQRPPFLEPARQTPEHATDLKAVIAWLRAQGPGPVWLVGTSRGTQSAAYVASELPRSDGPDGVVLTSTILTDDRSRPVPQMALSRISVPVLVVHHEEDACRVCRMADMPALMQALRGVPQVELVTFKGGRNTGDPCGAMAYHGYNGLEPEVTARIAGWILAR
jgi:dienelactone hydrolase